MSVRSCNCKQKNFTQSRVYNTNCSYTKRQVYYNSTFHCIRKKKICAVTRARARMTQISYNTSCDSSSRTLYFLPTSWTSLKSRTYHTSKSANSSAPHTPQSKYNVSLSRRSLPEDRKNCTIYRIVNPRKRDIASGVRPSKRMQARTFTSERVNPSAFTENGAI